MNETNPLDNPGWINTPDEVKQRLMELLKQNPIDAFREYAAFLGLELQEPYDDRLWVARDTILELHDPRKPPEPPLPCPQCGELLRTSKAQQCFECGADWHKSGRDD